MKRSMVVLALMVALVFSGAASAWAGNSYSKDYVIDDEAYVTCGPMLPGGSWDCYRTLPEGPGVVTACGPMLPGGSWDME